LHLLRRLGDFFLTTNGGLKIPSTLPWLASLGKVLEDMTAKRHIHEGYVDCEKHLLGPLRRTDKVFLRTNCGQHFLVAHHSCLSLMVHLARHLLTVHHN
jgi:hypothetical protein